MFYDEAFKRTMGHEGKYSNNPNDRGGETYAGIARKFHPDWSGWTHIDYYKFRKSFPKNIDHEFLMQRVKNFYKVHYWNKIRGDEIMDEAIACKIFDMAVNMGIYRASKITQRALSYLNYNLDSQDYLYADNLPIIGIIGPRTIRVLNKCINRGNDRKKLLKVIKCLQGAYYVTITERREKQRIFARGWINRV